MSNKTITFLMMICFVVLAIPMAAAAQTTVESGDDPLAEEQCRFCPWRVPEYALTLTPDSGPPGTDVTVTATFAEEMPLPGPGLFLLWGDEQGRFGSGPIELAYLTPQNGNREVLFNFTVPEVAPGSYYVTGEAFGTTCPPPEGELIVCAAEAFSAALAQAQFTVPGSGSGEFDSWQDENTVRLLPKTGLELRWVTLLLSWGMLLGLGFCKRRV